MIRSVFIEQLRFLLFLPIRPDLVRHRRRYLVYAVLVTLFAGVARYWDNPHASVVDRLGLGSVLYIFAIGTVLWLIVLPLGPKNWSWFSLIVFMGFCAPLAYIYGIPVERFMEPVPAAMTNTVFLGIVSVWRIALFYRHTRAVGQMSVLSSICATFLPVCSIIYLAAVSDYLSVMLQNMGGYIDPDILADMELARSLGVGAGRLGLALLVVYVILILARAIPNFREWKEDE